MNDSKKLIELGTRIKNTRTKIKMSQVALENKCQLKKGAIAKIEAGKYELRISTLFKISQALGIKIDDLV